MQDSGHVEQLSWGAVRRRMCEGWARGERKGVLPHIWRGTGTPSQQDKVSKLDAFGRTMTFKSQYSLRREAFDGLLTVIGSLR
jgi:hypothetical protein